MERAAERYKERMRQQTLMNTIKSSFRKLTDSKSKSLLDSFFKTKF